jgi:UDP-galactopyranose mutase
MRIRIVGAGLAGLTAARLLTDRGHLCTVYETRTHIGGNCYDIDTGDNIIQLYGAHIFHTRSNAIWKFIRRFSAFNRYRHKVLAHIGNGVTIPIPFNDISQGIVGMLSDNEILKLLFVPYSQKQWGVPFDKIPTEIIGRVKVWRAGKDCRYFLDRYQGIPSKGFHRLFERMARKINIIPDSHPKDWQAGRADLTIYTGKIDEYFNFKYGALKYRTSDILFTRGAPLPAGVVNECNSETGATRRFDCSHFYKRKLKSVLLGREYPRDAKKDDIPFYPFPDPVNISRFNRYRKLARQERNTIFLGRLGTYKYLDMDQVIAQVMRGINDV